MTRASRYPSAPELIAAVVARDLPYCNAAAADRPCNADPIIAPRCS
jgi:hypothetical protein